jgi:ketosteroid isomerase-like protein
MSQENVELIRKLYRGWERGDFSSVEWADPEIEFRLKSGPDEAVHHGVEAMRRAWREWLRAWLDFRSVADEFIDMGDQVLVLAQFRGRGKASGLSVDAMHQGAALFRVRDGKVVGLTTYTDRDEALEALGPRE